MKNRIEIAGVILTGPPWQVDGDPRKSAADAVETFMARIYNSTQDLPRAFVQYHRRVVGVGLACPMVMIRRERERAKMTIPELADSSGISLRTIQRIEAGDQIPRCDTAFDLLHACQSR